MSGTDLLAKYVTDCHPETQAHIAARFGVSQAYLSLLVSGDRTVRLLHIANAIERETGGAVPASSWPAPKGSVRRRSGSRARKPSNRSA
jgi:hypothetical protein